MKRFCFTALLLSLFTLASLLSQELNFENYKKFLEENKNLTADGLLAKFPPGVYKQKAVKPTGNINYYDSIVTKYKLTDYEKELLDNHGFMVSERLRFETFWRAFEDSYLKDLPVFISTDAILHALHMSYDAILKDYEYVILIDMLDDLLNKFYNQTIILKEGYKDVPQLQTMINDYDVYFTVAISLLHGSTLPTTISENNETVTELMGYIDGGEPLEIELFSKSKKWIDFSQFIVRGHYTESVKLSNYFRAMMWLGRIELYLIPPKNVISDYPFEDVQRQIIDSYLILEAVNELNLMNDINNFDNIIISLVGESDNVKPHHLSELKEELNIKSVTEFLDSSRCVQFQDTLATKSYADQKILSQLLIKNPFDINTVKPASAFLLFGQRFIIDSYVFNNVTYDRILNKRMLPSSLDVIYALGNNAAADFLKNELVSYSYAPNLSAMRYLIDSYDSTFWNMSIYNSWLSAIRTMNAPNNEERKKLPEFMQTAAWWQEKMNTQLASWAQLRHDNLLYAKQSYSPICTCSHPMGYVEPNPEFYHTLTEFAQNLMDKSHQILANFPNEYKYNIFKNQIDYYCQHFIKTSNTLESVSRKILNMEELTQAEKIFITSIFKSNTTDICGSPGPDVPAGWYDSLFYKSDSYGVTPDDGPDKIDFIVADVHTAPSNEQGDFVGNVKHVGTGPINLAVVIATGFDQQPTAFVGPVMSYYEYTTLNFDRLTDERWKESFLGNTEITPLRHEIVNLYLADTYGNRRYSNPYSLPVGVDEDNQQLSFSDLNISAYPNPFNDNTNLIFNLRGTEPAYPITIHIYNLSGNLIKTLYDSNLQNGNYVIKWDGLDNNNKAVPVGAYICQIELNGKKYSTKIIKK